MNLLFNKPADSDTLVAWYMLAQAHDLCGVDEQKNELRQDKAAWQINGSWSDKAAELIANDFDYTVSSWGLELAEKEEEKEEIRRKLQEFARVVYGTDEISAENVKNVLEALKKIFARAEEKAK